MFKLRAGKHDTSRSVMIAFHSKWQNALENSECSVVFRKFGPRHFVPEWMYAYMTAPISAIMAKIEIVRYEHLELEDAAKFAKQGLMTEQEVLSYGARYKRLFVFTVGSILMAKEPITLQHLADEYGFWPDSTYIALTITGETTLDELGEFHK